MTLKRINLKEKIKRKRRRRRKKKRTRINPIFLTDNLGTDDWDYLEKVQLEKEVLGDYL